MEQYEIRPISCNKTIQTALKYFALENLFIRCVGSKGRGVVVDSNLNKNRELAVRCTKSGFEFILRGKKVFFFEFTFCGDYVMGKKWSIAYERIKGDGVMIFASTGYPYLGSVYDGPDDPRLPEPEVTILRCANFIHLVEITFKGRIPIRKTKYKMRGVWDYWDIDPLRLPGKPL